MSIHSNKRFLAGWILSALPSLFLLFDSFGKLSRLPAVVEGTVRLGYPETVIRGLGILELLCLIAYLIPQTAVFGAVLLVGYLGGAVATHVRVMDPLFSHVLFPVYVATLLWAGLLLRNEGVRTFIPFLNRTGGSHEVFVPGLRRRENVECAE